MDLPSSPDAPVLIHGDCLEVLRRLPTASARVRFIGIERDPVTAECHDSFGVARGRIMAAIGSPEVAAEANEQAPVGAQLGLL